MAITRQDKLKNRKKKRVLKSVILSLLLLVLIVGGYGAYVFFNLYQAASDSYKPIDRADGHSKLREENVTIGKNPISILLMGVEDYSTGGKNGRTDTLIVATLNPETHKMTMTSIPRDSRVQIASRHNKLDKINSAYAYGSVNGYGANKAVIDTVENYLNIPIDYYVKVGFNGFVDVVNELNGVDVDIPFDFWEYKAGTYHKYYFKKGKQHLNGDQALAYVRMRDQDPRGDFGRNERQRQVISAAIDKAKSADIVFKVDDIASIIGKNVETNLKPSEIYALEKAYSSVDSSNIKTYDLSKGEGKKINGIWYFIPDEQNVQDVSNELRTQLGLDNNSTSNDGGNSNNNQ